MKRIQFSTALILSSIMSMSVSFADSDRPLFSVSVSESGVPQNNSEGGITRSSPQSHEYCRFGAMRPALEGMIYRNLLGSAMDI